MANNIAAALALTISYLDRSPSVAREDEDIEMLEAVAAVVQKAAPTEKKELIAALVGIGRVDLVDALGLTL